MKTAALLVAASVLLASGAFAQSSAPGTNVPPPPGIDDPGVKASSSPVESAVKRKQAGAPKSSQAPLILPPMKSGDSRLGRDASPPDVRVRQEGDINVQEYRRNGQVYMVVVTPRNGIQQIYTVDPQGRLVDEHGQKPVGPVMYKVLEWGKSRPPAEAAPADAQSTGGH